MTRQLGLLDEGVLPGADSPALDLRIRESRRARRLILQAVPPDRLEVVVPRGTRPHVVEAFVHAHRRWIEKARADLERRFGGVRDGLPSSVSLAAVGAVVEIVYAAEEGRPELVDDGSVVRLRGDAAVVPARARTLLRAWLLERARVHLVPWLLREAECVGERPRRIQVRLQRTRWGSCSARGTISLNASLLLVEPELVRYLMIHELCHLRRPNHSRSYWRLVERFEPEYRALDRRLLAAWSHMPVWVVQSAQPAA